MAKKPAVAVPETAQSTPTMVDDQPVDLFALIGDGASKGELVTQVTNPLVGASPSSIPDVERPKWMTDEEAARIDTAVEAFIKRLKTNARDLGLADQMAKLGKASGEAMLPHTSLYERKVSSLMKQNQEGSPVTTTLLSVKQHMDMVNPAVIRKRKIPMKILFLTLGFISRFPKGQEVLDQIYANRETVSSLITGLDKNLFTMAESLRQDQIEIRQIYAGLIAGQDLLERDIYLGHVLAREIKVYVDTMEEGQEKDNVKEALAELISRLIYLKDEELANQQFFANARMMDKLTRGQIHNITNLSRLLKRSVLANLGLAVTAAELEESVKVTGSLREAIGTTLVDTAQTIERTSGTLIAQRAEGGIDIEKLTEATAAVERAIALHRKANDEIITKGGQSIARLEQMTSRLREHNEGGHESMLAPATN